MTEELEQIGYLVDFYKQKGISVKSLSNNRAAACNLDKKMLTLHYRIGSFRTNMLAHCREFNSKGKISEDLKNVEPWFCYSKMQSNAQNIRQSFIAFKEANPKFHENYTVSFDDVIAVNANADENQLVEFRCISLGMEQVVELPDQVPTDSIGCEDVEARSLVLTWKGPSVSNGNITHLRVMFRPTCSEDYEEKKLLEVKSTFPTSTRIDGLNPNTTYYFKLQIQTPWGVMPMPDGRSEAMRTESGNQMAQQLKASGEVVTDKKWTQVKITVPQKMAIDIPKAKVLNDNQVGGVRAFAIGQPANYPTHKEKVLLLVGGTGHGKTTLLNSIVNYIYGVQKEDDYRFKLVSEEEETEESGSDRQTVSKTRWVTAYILRSSKLDYQLTLVDTPGFGDTAGAERDRLTTQCIKAWIEQQESGRLDAVCLVAKSTVNRLTAQMKFVLNQITDLFGKDIKDNIIPLLTFSDASCHPLALEALKESQIDYKKYYSLNNCAIFEGNNLSSMQSMFYDQAMKSLDDFFCGLSNLDPCSLTLSNEVCKNREQLERCIVSLNNNVQRSINKLHEMDQQFQVMRNHEAEIKHSEKFEYEIVKYFTEKHPTPPGTNTTTCLDCNETCHYACNYDRDDNKGYCEVMDHDGNCRVCRHKCSWEKHRNLPYVLKSVQKTVKETNEDLKKQYGDATKMKQSYDNMLKRMALELMKYETSICEDIKQIRDCINQINTIAMSPTRMTDVSYIQLLIDIEKERKTDGYHIRLQQYYHSLEIAKAISEVNEPNYDPLLQYHQQENGWVRYLSKRYPKWDKRLKKWNHHEKEEEK